MDSKEFNPDIHLSTFLFIPESVLIKLWKYNIQTIGQLLSTTKGLTKTSEFFQMEEEKRIVDIIRNIVPQEIISLHETYSSTHSTGLLINKKDDNEKAK